jgi:hypothetical protein
LEEDGIFFLKKMSEPYHMSLRNENQTHITKHIFTQQIYLSCAGATPAATTADTPAAAPIALMVLGEVPQTLEEGETLIVEETRPPSPPPFHSKDTLGLYQLVLLVLKHEYEDITASRIHVHPLTSRLQVPRSQKIIVFICHKSEWYRSDKAVNNCIKNLFEGSFNGLG